MEKNQGVNGMSPPPVSNLGVSKDKALIISVKDGAMELEPSEKDRLKEDGGNVEDERYEGDPTHTVEGQVVLMTSSKKDLSGSIGANRRFSTISNKALGWKRYLGLIFTLLSTNMFSLSSNVLKLMGHINPLNLGAYAFPMGAILSAPFIWYTLKVEKKPVATNLLPFKENKKVWFFMWVGDPSA